MYSSFHSSLLVIAAVVGLALNLRPALAGIGPMLDLIEATTGLTHTQASLLTTLPVFVMGLCALSGHRLRRWLGESNGIGAGVALIAVACLARSVATDRIGLLTTAVIVGIGIALVQTLLPAFIKRRFSAESGRVMGLYSAAIMGGAAIAAASAAGLAERLGWPAAAAAWALPAAISLPLWAVACRQTAGSISAAVPELLAYQPFWRSLRAWELLFFFGIGTAAYTLVLAWLPPFYTALGWTRAEAGLLLGALTITQVIAGLGVAALIGRFPDRRKPLLTVLALLTAGLLC